jgi:phosphoribosylformylglycinamidine cyclo-ligase
VSASDEQKGDRRPTARLDYRTSGVDIDAADEAKRRLRALVESTFTSGARGRFGGFGGLFHIPPGSERSLLVSSADGVGTKVRIAIESGRHDTIGSDLVNHCVNDILVQGALPLFFLDYVAFGVLEPSVVEAVVAGVARGCRENGCALIGGETAEMPGLYAPRDYDLAGFIVGIVDENRLLGPDRVRKGDVMVALASNGFHTNGYSLVRRVLVERLKLGVDDHFPEGSSSVADVLLKVHRSYLRAVEPVLTKLHAMAHITGGGIVGNLPRVLPATVDAQINTGSWDIPTEFGVIARAGQIGRDEMFRVFNMGVGLVTISAPDAVQSVLSAARGAGVDAWTLGEITGGEGRVILN